jgi:hypothetical protein
MPFQPSLRWRYDKKISVCGRCRFIFYFYNGETTHRKQKADAFQIQEYIVLAVPIGTQYPCPFTSRAYCIHREEKKNEGQLAKRVARNEVILHVARNFSSIELNESKKNTRGKTRLGMTRYGIWKPKERFSLARSRYFIFNEFFLNDFYIKLSDDHLKSPKDIESVLHLCREKTILINELNKIRENLEEFLSMNNYLSTTLNQIISTSELTRILFEFEINQSILIGLGSIFQISENHLR